MWWKRPEGLSGCGGWRVSWAKEKDLSLQADIKTWRIWLKIRAENQNISGKIRTLHSASGFESVALMGEGLSINFRVPRPLNTLWGCLCPLFKVLQPIKWNGFHIIVPLLSILMWQLQSSQKKHRIDWFYNPNNPIWRSSSDSLSLM